MATDEGGLVWQGVVGVIIKGEKLTEYSQSKEIDYYYYFTQCLGEEVIRIIKGLKWMKLYRCLKMCDSQKLESQPEKVKSYTVIIAEFYQYKEWVY